MEIIPICIDCKYLSNDVKCLAFPNGIPGIITSGENDHAKPLKDQKNKIVFTPIKK